MTMQIMKIIWDPDEGKVYLRTNENGIKGSSGVLKSRSGLFAFPLLSWRFVSSIGKGLIPSEIASS